MSWLRKIAGISRLQHIRNEEIRKITGNEETAVDKIKTRRLRWFGHVSRMDNNRLPNLALHTQVEGQRSVGRQRARWRDGVMEDIRRTGGNIAEVLSSVKDREKWKAFVRPYRRNTADGRD